MRLGATLTATAFISGVRGVTTGVADAIPVLSLVDGQIQPIGRAHDPDEAANLMADAVTGHGTDLRVGISVADAASAPLWQALEQRLANEANVIDLVRYRGERALPPTDAFGVVQRTSLRCAAMTAGPGRC